MTSIYAREFDLAVYLLETPHALNVLDGLGRDYQPRQVVGDDADTECVDTAVACLAHLGLVRRTPVASLELTAKGRYLLSAVHRADRTGDSGSSAA